MDRPERLQRLTRVVRSALADLFDQSTGSGRLALVHTLASAASTAVAVGLAGTLFFAISLKEAESRVLLYLLITIAPFAVVAPMLSPLLDRGRQARRSAVVIAAGGSALLCLAMVRDVNGPLLFPEAFGILVLSKLYLVARAALVPAIVGPRADLATANSRLAVLSALAGFAVSPLAVGFLQIGAGAVMGLAAVVFGAAVVAAVRLPKLEPAPAAPDRTRAGAAPAGGGGGTSAAPSSAAVPAPAPGRSYGAGYDATYGAVAASSEPAPVLYGPAAPALASAAPGDPVGGADAPYRTGGSRGGGPAVRSREARTLRKGLGLSMYHQNVLAAFTAMCVVRGSVGFVTFFLAFALKRAHAATWWYGFIVLASGIGGLAGSMMVPRIRRFMTEQRMILVSLALGCVFAIATALIGGMWAQPLLTFVVGFAGTTAKPAFDSLVQREVPGAFQGRAFARFETLLQLAWVFAALLAVLIDFRLGDGDVVIAVACGTAACFYVTMGHSGHRQPAGVQAAGAGSAPVTS